MAKAAVLAGTGGQGAACTAGTSRAEGSEISARVAAALQRRLGAERYAVWFGGGVAIEFEPPAGARKAGGTVVVTAANTFSQEWLKRTFRGDLEAVVRETCGRNCGVVWRTTAAMPVAPAVQPERPPEPRREPAAATPATTAIIAVGPRDALLPGPSRSVGLTRRPTPGLDGFVSGASNRMALAAVELAVSRPGEMSPLVIHGPSGVGKSHLLEGMCGRFREVHPGSTTLFLSAEQFTTSFLQALHGSGLPGFRRGCRSADLLVIDDLQFFVGKKATLMEVQQTVDTLHRQGRQMVFACDRDPASLDGLGPDLVARFQGGMVARIEPPDYDVRRGIVAGIAASRGLLLPEDVVHYVATHMTRQARELLGAVNRLEAASLMLGLPISFGMAEEALSDLVRSSGRSVRLADIERAVCSAFGIEAGSLQSSGRSRSFSQPRMLAMFLARRHTTAALAEIGGYFGRRSHSTVISAQKTVEEWVARRTRIVLAEAEWDVEEAIRRAEQILRAG